MPHIFKADAKIVEYDCWVFVEFHTAGDVLQVGNSPMPGQQGTRPSTKQVAKVRDVKIKEINRMAIE